VAEPKTRYEYGRTPEETAPGLLGLFNFLKGPLVDAFTPVRREVITPSKTTYTDIDGMFRPAYTPGVYGAPERGLEYMPVVQGARSAYNFLGDLISSGKTREETARVLRTGIATLIEDQKRAAINAGRSGGLGYYDPEQKRAVRWDPLLAMGPSAMAGALLPVKGPGAVLGMFAGREAATADLKKLAQAEKMAAKGHSREEIWDQTGWFRWMRDGEPVSPWKFEISDLGSEVFYNPKFQTPTGKLKKSGNPVLSDFLEHPEFFKAFPGRLLAAVTQSGGALKYASEELRPDTPASSIKSIERQRAVLAAKLKELKASKKSVDEKSAEYKELQDQDTALIQQYIEAMNDAGKLKVPVSAGAVPPFRDKGVRMARPVSDIELETKSSRDWGGAHYNPHTDVIGIKGRHLPPPPFELSWRGNYVTPFTGPEYKKALDKALEDFRKAGISLDRSISRNRTEYSLRKWGATGAPENAIDPKSLPKHLKKQWDQLQEFGTIHTKKDAVFKDRTPAPTGYFRSAALHEGQHSIQYRTPGFEGGGNPREFSKTVVKDRTTGKKLSPAEIYMRTLGEMEARLVQARRDFPDTQRKGNPPWTREGGLDRPEGDLILRKDLGHTDPWDIDKPAGKSTGGFVDRPLYEDARMIG